MSQNLSPPNPMESLSLGNVVTAGFILYRSHLKSYFLQALTVFLWSILPFLILIPTVVLLFNNSLSGITPFAWLIVLVLGLALYFYANGKSLVNASIISRLAFAELVNQPENLATARRQVQPKQGRFVLIALLLFVISFCLFIPIIIILIIPLLNLLLFPPVLAAFIWVVARFFITDVILAVEENNSAIDAVSRSWELTKGNGWRIVLILVVAFLLTIPLQIILQLINSIFPQIIQKLLQNGVNVSTTTTGLISMVYLIILALANAIILPLWQTIKAVIYYDLRTRREGLDLKLRNNC